MPTVRWMAVTYGAVLELMTSILRKLTAAAATISVVTPFQPRTSWMCQIQNDSRDQCDVGERALHENTNEKKPPQINF